MKYLFALILLFATINLNANAAEAIPSQQEAAIKSQLQAKQRNQQKQNSARLYVNSKVTANGVYNRYLILSPQGIAIRTKAGNFSRIQKNINRRNLGRYRRQGNKLTIRWHDGKTWQLSSYRNGWRIGKRKSHANTFYPPIPITNRLNGKYVAESTRNAGFTRGPAPRVTAYKKNTFVFSANGRFSHAGFAGASGTTYNNTGDVTGRGAGTSTSANGGIYRVRGYSLNLQYRDGKRLNHTIFKLPGWKDSLMIDGRIFLKRK